MSRSAALRREADQFAPPSDARDAALAFAPESIPVDETTAPPVDLVEQIRAGLNHLLAANGREVRS